MSEQRALYMCLINQYIIHDLIKHSKDFLYKFLILSNLLSSRGLNIPSTDLAAQGYDIKILDGNYQSI
jgi:hypothetical protein